MADHIQIGDVAPRVQYAADGVQTSFTYPFPIFEASDLEFRLDGVVTDGGFAITGAGNSAGGSVVFDRAPAAGRILTFRRRLVIERVTDFQSNGVLRANTLNDELDFQTAAIQEMQDDLGGAMRLDPSEVGGNVVLPLRAARANKLLGFDSVGDVTAIERGEANIAVVYPGAVPRTVEDKLAERLSARDFGATGDGATDDTAAVQAAMNAAAASGKLLEIGEGTFRVTQPLLLAGGAAGLFMRGTILYAGAPGRVALTVGDGGSTRNGQKVYRGLRVVRAIQSDWTSETDIGLVLRNLDGCLVEILQAEGFTIGVRTLGDARGVQECTFFLGRIVNNQVGLDIHTGTASGWNNSCRYYGGQFSVGSTVNTTLDRFGVRLSAENGAYVAHNRHVFDAPAFALQGKDSTAFVGIPFLSQVTSRAIAARMVRMEGCSAFVARHTGGAQDHVYEIAWASQGYAVDIDYAATATRVGSVVRGLHQAAAHREFTRDLVATPNMRAAAIRWSATETGFAQMACLSTSVSGSPAQLADFAFPALDSYALTNRGVMLTGGRGVGFVVDARNCREFALAVDADSPRLVVQCFDSNMTYMDNSSPNRVRASGQSIVWNPGARWFQGSTDMTDGGLTRLQVIRLDPLVAYAIIGVARVDTNYEVRAMRLASDPSQAPSVLFGQPDLPLGRRELIAELALDPPAIAAGATWQVNVPVTGARPGDFVEAAYGLATTGMVFLAQVGAQDTVTVTLWNRTAASLDLNAGTLRVRLVKG